MTHSKRSLEVVIVRTGKVGADRGRPGGYSKACFVVS